MNLPLGDLAAEIVQRGPEGLQLRQAIVLALNGDTTAQVRLAESGTILPRALLLNASVNVGDTVWLLGNRPDLGVILGGGATLQTDRQGLIIRKNSGIEVGPRRRLNLIEGTNVTLLVADDVIDDEVDVIVTATGGGGGGGTDYGPRMRSDLWYSHHPMSSSNVSQMPNGVMVAALFPATVGGTVKSLAVSVQTAGGTGSVVRLGIYRDDGSSYPGERLVDAGTVSATTVGIRTVSFSNLVLSADWYWLVAVGQGNPSPAPYVRGRDETARNPFIGSDTAETSTIITQWEVSGITGALPNPFPVGAFGREGGASYHVAVQSA